MRYTKTLGLFSTFILLVCSTQADVTVYEGYDYTVGALTSSANGGSGWDGGYYYAGSSGEPASSTVIAGSLSNTAYNLPSVGNHTSVAAGGLYTRTLNTPINISSGTTTMFFSYLMEVTSVTTSGNNFNYLSMNVDGGQTGLLTALRYFNASGTSDLRLMSALGGGAVSYGDPLAFNTTYFIVGRLVNDGTNLTVSSSAFDTSVPPSSEPLIWDTETSRLGSEYGVDAVIDELRVRAAADGGVLFDELRVGTTYESVAVPEPSQSALLFGLSGALLLFIRGLKG